MSSQTKINLTTLNKILTKAPLCVELHYLIFFLLNLTGKKLLHLYILSSKNNNLCDKVRYISIF